LDGATGDVGQFHGNVLQNKRLMFTCKPSGSGETLKGGIPDQEVELDERNVCKIVHLGRERRRGLLRR
jgi:hypothetical protein